MFYEFFMSDIGKTMYVADTLITQSHVFFNVFDLEEMLPFSDCEISLRLRPAEVSGFIGIALSLVARKLHPYFEGTVVIKPRFYGLNADMSFGDMKSSCVGQMVSIRGHVVRASACRPLVESAAFMCAKCMRYTHVRFEDGIFMPPPVCSTEK